MHLPVDAIEDGIMPVVHFIRQATGDHASDQLAYVRCQGIVDGEVGVAAAQASRATARRRLGLA